MTLSIYRFESMGVNSVVQFITLLIVFVFVLAITYWTTRFIGNYQKNTNHSTNFDVIETYRVSNTKYIQLMRIGEKYYAISICKDSMTVLAELEGDEVIIPERREQESFSKILEKIRNGRYGTQEGKEQDNDEDKGVK